MPEVAEVHHYSRSINKWASGKTFTKLVVNSPNAKRHPPVHAASSFSITSETRGKEQRLTLRPIGGGHETSIVFNHGLVGNWAWAKQNEFDNSLIKFETSDGMSLRFIDAQRLASWHEGTWGADRGPDPLEDYDKFRENVLRNVNSKMFSKPIAEVLLNQDFFNGIGNYLRAEILHRACIDPLISGTELFTGTSSNLMFMHQGKQVRKSDLLLALCRAIPREVLDQGLNKYGSPSEKASFHEWLRCYDKSQFTKDKGGRKIWYVPGNHTKEPTEQDKNYLTQSSSSTPSSFSLQSQPTTPAILSFFAPSLSQQQTSFSPSAVSSSTGSKPTTQFQGSTRAPSQLTQELVLVGLLYKGNKIGEEERKILKLVAFDRSGKYNKLKDALAATLECFQADKDFDNAADTLLHVCKCYNRM